MVLDRWSDIWRSSGIRQFDREATRFAMWGITGMLSAGGVPLGEVGIDELGSGAAVACRRPRRSGAQSSAVPALPVFF